MKKGRGERTRQLVDLRNSVVNYVCTAWKNKIGHALCGEQKEPGTRRHNQTG